MHRICNAAGAKAPRGFESPSRLSFRPSPTEETMAVCRNCGNHFPSQMKIDGKLRNLNRRRYCLSCSPFGVHNTRRIHQPRTKNLCVGCGSPTNNPSFCSNRCQQRQVWVRTKDQIATCGKVAVGASGCGNVAKRYLLETRGKACEICGGIQWCGKPIPLVLDHINGNSEDWSLTNLRLVCGNCDMQLPTYKSRNRGRGRAWRRKRYAAGASY